MVGMRSRRMRYYYSTQQPLLDALGVQAAAAYSLRRLSSGATAAVRVRTGSNELDIGFAPNGDLDLAALASFCGSNDGFVTTWYDQSGANVHATQSTASQQPKIWDSSVNYLSRITFDGLDDFLQFQCPTSLLGQNAKAVYFVGFSSASPVIRAVISLDVATGTSAIYGVTLEVGVRVGGGSAAASPYVNTNSLVFVGNPQGGTTDSVVIRVNGIARNPTVSSQSINTQATNYGAFGMDVNGRVNCTFQEVLMLNAGSFDSAIEQSMMQAWGL